jgi:uncharacterized protein (TIGR02246 family)
MPACSPRRGLRHFPGQPPQGREAIAASHVSLLKEFLKGSRLDTQITQLRFLTPDVALIHAKGAVVKGHGGGIDAIPR